MISVIIPTYNEKENIQSLVQKILEIGLHNNLNLEIIIVDDSSPDGTVTFLQETYKKNPQVKIYTRTKERGLATAIRHGINMANGDIIIGMDADFNHHPKHIVPLINALKTADLVVGSRFIKGGGMDDKIRHNITYVFNLFLKHMLGFPTSDNMSGFYAIRTKELRNMPLEKTHIGYGEYHLRMIWEAKKNNLTIKEIPVYYTARTYGKSKSHLGALFFTYVHCALRLRFGDK